MESAEKTAKRFLHNVRCDAYLSDTAALIELIQQAREDGARWALSSALEYMQRRAKIVATEEINPANARKAAP